MKRILLTSILCLMFLASFSFANELQLAKPETNNAPGSVIAKVSDTGTSSNQITARPIPVKENISNVAKIQAAESNLKFAVNPKYDGSKPSNQGSMILDAPLNDDCVNAEDINAPYPLSINGTTVEATVDCPGVLDWNGVWYAIELPYTANNINIDFCATTAAGISTIGIVLMEDCSCANYILANNYDFVDTCSGTSFSQPVMNWYNVSGPGTIYFPCNVEPAMAFTFDIDVTQYLPPTPDFTVTAPGTWTGTTCGAGNDCIVLMPSVDRIYQINIPSDSIWTFSLCDGDSAFDSWIGLGTSTCNADIAFNDDFCGLRAQVTARLTAGTYYLTIEGANPTNCGAYELDVYLAPPPPANDLCSAVTPFSLPINTTITRTGDNTGALNDCDSLTSAQAWEAFTTTEAMDIVVDYCGTVGYENYYIVLFDDCPCGVTRLSAYSYEFTTCVDSNITILFHDVPAGTYYLPVLMSPANATNPAVGPYTIHFRGSTPALPPANDLCTSVTPVSLFINDTVSFTGNNSFATNDCDSLDYAQVWHAITTTDSLKITVDYCGTGDFTRYQTVMVEGCPCGSLVYRTSTDFTTCTDSSITIVYGNVPPGTYYIPVALVPPGSTGSAQGPYTMHVSGLSPAPPEPSWCVTSVYSNGEPFGGAAGSQCDPVYPFAAGVADDFVLSGTGTIDIDTVIGYLGFWNGGLDPTGMTGIVVTFYADNAGFPGGRPISGDPDCDHEELVAGGIISSQVIDAANYTYREFPVNSGVYELAIPITTVSLTAGTTYWLELAPIISFTEFGQGGMVPTTGITGSGAMQVFALLGAPNFALLNPARDMAFCLKVSSAPECDYLIGDISGDGQRLGGDVTYGVRYFKGVGTAPKDSCYMDSTHAYLYVAGDCNGNCEFRGSDITKLVAYFKGTTTLAYCHFFPTTLPRIVRPTPEPFKASFIE